MPSDLSPSATKTSSTSRPPAPSPGTTPLGNRLALNAATEHLKTLPFGSPAGREKRWYQSQQLDGMSPSHMSY
jgi:hypothetical protein